MTSVIKTIRQNPTIMSKTAIIELDSSVVELNFHLQAILPNYPWGKDKKERLIKAVEFIFQLTMDECLIWVPPNEIALRQRSLADDVAAILGIEVKRKEKEAFLGAMEDGINEYVYRPMYKQLSQVIGSKSPYRWHVMGKGTYKVITMGGIVIDLDRLNGATGLVEIDLTNHWRSPSKTAHQSIADDAADEPSKQILKDIEQEELKSKRGRK